MSREPGWPLRERGVVDRLDGVLNHALVILSAALQLDGEPQRNPFARFAPLGPGASCSLWFRIRPEAPIRSRLEREPHWSSSIAVGSRAYVDRVAEDLRGRARHRSIASIDDTFVIRETDGAYGAI